jgi:Predicted ABC-type transport system involved in lysophospholipase L1 biosynthesis, permease component
MIKLLWRLFLRMGWQGGLQWFVVALAICIASVLSVSLVSDRLTQSLTVSGRDFLAADLVIDSARPLPEEWLKQARTFRLQLTHTTEFSTMLLAGEQMQLASVKAVESGYPFYGRLQLSPQQTVRAGELWLSKPLMLLLQVKPGEMVQLGSTSLKVAGELLQEPDQSFNPLALAPRAIMHQHDVGAAQILLPGSRVTHRYLFHGDAAALTAWEQWLTPRLQVGQKLLKPEQANRNLSRQLERSERFFRVASLLGLLLGAIAMSIAIQQYARQTQTMLALLKTFGASRWRIMLLLGGLLCLLTLSGIVIGCLLGWLVHSWMVWQLRNALPPELATPTIQPFILAFVLGSILVALLVCIPLWRLLDVPALRVLRQEQESRIPSWLTLPLLVVGLLAINLILLQDTKLVLGLLGGVIILILILGCIGYLLLRLLPKGETGSSFYLAVQHWQRQPLEILHQLSGIALSLLLLGVIMSVRSEIVSGFQTFLPADAPNRFLINIPDSDKVELEHFLQQHQLTHAPLYPIVRGRLTHINGEPVTQQEGQPGRPGIHRELTMTAQAQLPTDSIIVSGKGWSEGMRKQVSIEQGVAAELNIKLGDQLQFTADDQSFTVTVRNIRQVDWQSMRPNFFMIFSPDVLQPFVVNWMTSLRVPPDKLPAELELARTFPTITSLNIDDLLNKLQGVLDKLAKAMTLLMLLVSAAAIQVLLVQWQAGLQQRQISLLLMRMLGARRQQLRNMLHWQAILLGGFAGITAAFSCELFRWWLHAEWSEQPWQWLPMLWWLLPLSGAVTVLLVSQFTLQPLLRRTLAERLRAL